MLSPQRRIVALGDRKALVGLYVAAQLVVGADLIACQNPHGFQMRGKMRMTQPDPRQASFSDERLQYRRVRCSGSEGCIERAVGRNEVMARLDGLGPHRVPKVGQSRELRRVQSDLASKFDEVGWTRNAIEFRRKGKAPPLSGGNLIDIPGRKRGDLSRFVPGVGRVDGPFGSRRRYGKDECRANLQFCHRVILRFDPRLLADPRDERHDHVGGVEPHFIISAGAGVCLGHGAFPS